MIIIIIIIINNNKMIIINDDDDDKEQAEMSLLTEISCPHNGNAGENNLLC